MKGKKNKLFIKIGQYRWVEEDEKRVRILLIKIIIPINLLMLFISFILLDNTLYLPMSKRNITIKYYV